MRSAESPLRSGRPGAVVAATALHASGKRLASPAFRARESRARELCVPGAAQALPELEARFVAEASEALDVIDLRLTAYEARRLATRSKLRELVR